MQGPPHNPWGQPPYPPGPQPQQPQAYGQQPQAQGQPQPYGQPPQGYGPPQGHAPQPHHAPQPPGGFGGAPYPPQPLMPMQHHGPVASVGIFGHLPCPHCGMPTRSNAGDGAHAARFAGGLVGWLIASALLTKYYCLSHGEILPVHFPPAHQSAITTRKILKIGGGVALLLVVFAIFGILELAS